MALDPANVRVAVTGAVYAAPVGTTAPTDSTTAYGAGWIDLGWVSEDGIEETHNDDSKEIKGWQGGATIRRVISSSSTEFKFTLLESNPDVLELFHKGDTVGSNKILVHSPDPDERAFGFDVVDGSNHLRIIIARGEVTDRGAIKYVSADAVGYELTVTAYPDADGLVLTKFSDDTDWA